MNFKTLKLAWPLLLVLSLMLAACGGDDDGDDEAASMVTIGVLNHALSLDPVVEGFKSGMTDLGYVEGENITYLYEGPTGGVPPLDPLAASYVEQGVDLILATGTPPTAAALTATQDADIPIIFAPVNDPVAAGFVASLSAPGGSITGVQNSISTGRALQWLNDMLPDAQRVLVPHNPNDESSIADLATLTEAAEQLGLELVVVEVTNPDEVQQLVNNLPEDVDAIFILRAGLINSRAAEWVTAAMRSQIPVVTNQVGELVDRGGIMLGYGADRFETGRQAAVLADRVLKGSQAGTLPVETAKSFLAINLRSATAANVTISDELLSQADYITRPQAAE